MTPSAAATLAGRFRALARQRDPVLDDCDRAHLVELIEHFQDEERKERRRLLVALAAEDISPSGHADGARFAAERLEAVEADQEQRAPLGQAINECCRASAALGEAIGPFVPPLENGVAILAKQRDEARAALTQKHATCLACCSPLQNLAGGGGPTVGCVALSRCATCGRFNVAFALPEGTAQERAERIFDAGPFAPEAERRKREEAEAKIAAAHAELAEQFRRFGTEGDPAKRKGDRETRETDALVATVLGDIAEAIGYEASPA